MAGATVVVTNQNNGTSNQVVTNAQGVYFVPFLQPGQYTVAAKFQGFSSFTQTGIRLDVQQVLTLDIAMTVGDVSISHSSRFQEPPRSWTPHLRISRRRWKINWWTISP